MDDVKPYYETDNGVLYHGDCLEIMAYLPPVDMVLTDPPYGINWQSHHRHEKHQKIINDERLPIEHINTAISLAKKASYVFCRWDQLHQFTKPKSVLVWVKNNWSMGDLKHEHGRQWEAICFYPGVRHKFKKRIPDVIYDERTGNGHHPTEKPVSLLIKLIDANLSYNVLDPFMGSGTTALACERLGRRWIGIEIDEKYCEIAANRIDQENRQLKLFG